MPEIAFEDLRSFGKAVKAARSLKGLTLDQAGFETLGRDNAKGYFSQIENGKRQITSRTAGKIITALEMDPALLEPFLGEDEIAEDEVTKADTDAEKLIAKVQADDTGAVAGAGAGVVTGDRLLIDLAYEFAQGDHIDLFTAYKSLRSALEAAAELKAQGNLPQNTSSQLDAVLRRVSQMNEEGDREGAADYLDAEEKRLDAEAEALFNAQLKQDRVRNRPDLAAKRLYKYTARKAHETGMKRFFAIDELSCEFRFEGDKSGDMFSLQVALELAKTNNDAASGKYAAWALYTLGWSYFRLAERSPKDGLLKAAQKAFQAALQKTNKVKEPLNWVARQDGLAGILQRFGERNRDPDTLRKSISAFRATLKVVEKQNSSDIETTFNNLGNALQLLGELTADPVPLKEAVTLQTNAVLLIDKTADPIEWETSQGNLGLALRWLGAITENLEALDQAREAYGECEELDLREEAPMLWAMNQWNIADLAMARFALDPDPALLVEAREYVTRARDFFVEGSEYQTQRCDDLIARIDAVEIAA